MHFAACIEWLFADTQETLEGRVAAAKAAGFPAVEIHLWRSKNIPALRAALDGSGVRLDSLCVDPRRSLVDPAEHGEFLDAVKDSLEAAKALDCKALVVASGFTREGVPHQEQHQAIVEVLTRAAALAAEQGLTLLLEPLNTRVEHPGMFLSSTAEGLDIVQEVNSPHLRLLLDVYHSSVMDEDLAAVLGGRVDLVGHVQFADKPGRGEPGSGVIDWTSVMRTLKAVGYDKGIGLEFKPTGPMVEVLPRLHAALGV